MIWIVVILIIIFILIIAIFGGGTPQKKLNYSQLQAIKQIRGAENFNKINSLPPLEALYQIEKLPQDIIDDIESFKNDNFNDWVIERAFRKRHRWGEIDTEFWVNEINTREYNKLHNIKKKIKRRTKEEIFNDYFPKTHDDFYEKIDGYIYVRDFEIKGVHVSNRFGYIEENCEINEELTLEKDDLNRFDAKAVKIKHRQKTIGFVSADETYILRKAIEFGYICKLCDFADDNGYRSAYFSLYVKKLNDI